VLDIVRLYCATAILLVLFCDLNETPSPLVLSALADAPDSTGVTMPQQSLSDFVSAMEAAGMLVRVNEEKRVDELPRVMEDYPTTAVLVEKITGCEFSFLANAYSNQDQYAWAMGCKKAETGMKMVEASRERIAPVVVDTAPCKEVILTGDYVDMTIFPMFLHHERDGQSYSDDNLVVSKDPDTGVYDWGFYRSMFRARNERGFDMTCTSHRARINAQKAATSSVRPSLTSWLRLRAFRRTWTILRCSGAFMGRRRSSSNVRPSTSWFLPTPRSCWSAS
jgi:hypothetical protein